MQSMSKCPSLRRARLAAAVMFATTFPAEAAPLTVVNPGFEDLSGEVVFNEFTFGPLNGWSLYDPANITSGGAGNTFFIGTLTPSKSTRSAHRGSTPIFPMARHKASASASLLTSRIAAVRVNTVFSRPCQQASRPTRATPSRWMSSILLPAHRVPALSST